MDTIETQAPTPLSSEHRTSPTRGSDMEVLGEEIALISSQMDAASYYLLTRLRDFDEGQGWNNQGFRSCAHWLSWRTGSDRGSAREKVRVARALAELPTISEEMRCGRLSYSKVRAMTRVATAQNEEELLHFARAGTAAHVERLVRGWRQTDRQEFEQEKIRHASRYLHAYRDEDGMVVVHGRLEAEAGAALLKALDAAGEVLYESSKDPENAYNDLSSEQQRSDALGLVAESALNGGLDNGTRGDRYQVVVHVKAEELRDHEDGRHRSGRYNIPTTSTGGTSARRPQAPPSSSGGTRARRSRALPSTGGPQMDESTGRNGSSPVAAETHREPSDEHGTALLRALGAAFDDSQDDLPRAPRAALRRIACEASTVRMTHAEDGSILDVGRKTRAIHPALRRALGHRDGRCQFPGCEVSFCDAHHIEHWADGGATSLENLVLLCRRHHRCVHEEGFQLKRLPIEGLATPRYRLQFYRPDGRPIDAAPATPDIGNYPVEALIKRLLEDGIEIDPNDSFPLWNGGSVDFGFAVQAFRALGTSRTDNDDADEPTWDQATPRKDERQDVSPETHEYSSAW